MAAKAEARALTGLRGIAALLVAVYHINPELIAPSALGHAIGKGYLWVDVFFILSGFVLALNYTDRFMQSGRFESWIDFLLRRVARVYPLYLVMFALAAAAALVRPRAAALIPLLPAPIRHHPVVMGLANLLMVQSWGAGPSVDGAAWSLSAEWAAYLLFPLLVALAFASRRRITLGVAGAAALAIVATALLTGADGEAHSGPLDAYNGATAEPMLRCLGGFVLGLLMYRAAHAGVPDWLNGDAAIAIVAASIAAAFAADAYDLLIYPLFPALVLGLYGNRGAAARILGSRTLHRLGVISYSVYLVHPYLVAPKRGLETALATQLPAPAADLGASVCIYALLFLLSDASYRCIEEPGRRVLGGLALAWRERRHAATAGVAEPL